MAHGVDGATTTREQEERTPGSPGTPARDGAAGSTRRDLVRGLLVPALAVTLAPAAAACRPFRSDPHAAGHTEGAHGDPFEGVVFEETYRGRRIRGIRTATGRAVGAGTWHVTVDGRPLHLMRRADGTWLTMVDHYRSYPTPLEAARAAVDELGPGRHLRETGGAHGVHA
ncbi:tyrosinase [Streptomyces sp. SW4]|nr:tyrosinase [Streptomyces sp. SW4]